MNFKDKIVDKFKSNKAVIENYIFMTILQILNSLFYIIIYPYVIRVLGVENYGIYIYTVSIVTYFIFLINFGFDFPATKAVAENKDNVKALNDILSYIFTAKIYLQILSSIIFCILIFSIPFLRNNKLIYFIIYLQTFANILFPQWYYQGLQKMKTVTIIQVVFKLISLPFIFIFVKKVTDLSLFATVTTFTMLAGAMISFLMIRYQDGFKIKLISFNKTKSWFKQGTPFFLSTSVGVFKEQGVTIAIGAFFGMKDVAIYDLANKIVIIPRTLLMSVNAAMFPKIVIEAKKHVIKKIIKYEFILGILVMIFIAIFGKWVIQLLGGEAMISAYPLSIILSFTVVSWLVVGAYISFVFIPNNKNYFVVQNQLVALISVVVFSLIGYIFSNSIFILICALALSGLAEIIFCYYKTFKNNLL
ncbi:oligosaccharide flippase family protein [Chryseobacterium sp. PMSZPI]|uniref:oligosaccharide flippase family protein n=1 Tax=Chryseobacterium sp. PMSZPI TaxID=1033900 RepID=UPI0016171E66|nr:oligosaccharide flippase family protein [Chryseobacterium sp. PMSZPI]